MADGKKVAVVVTSPFGFSHDGGVTVTTYEVGEQEVDEDVADHAVRTEKATLAKSEKATKK